MRQVRARSIFIAVSGYSRCRCHDNFEKVMAVEANPTAVRFARRNLQDAGFDNARVVAASVADWFRSGPMGDVDFVLLDPPRAGAESAVIKGILDLHPPQISYVSCDPATLARDLKKLVAGGYTDRFTSRV